ncbi:MAG TPA: hypothetical protein VHO69_11075 [Phototrophicaceae bacterium]|nr:hypothetical protein [Phototrophicaceae bacterium]
MSSGCLGTNKPVSLPYSRMQLAEAFIMTGELADALAALNQHLDETPADQTARRLRAEVLLHLPLSGNDHLEAALEDLDALAELTAADWVQRSIVRQRLGDLSGALADILQAHTLTPADDRITARYLELLLLNEDRSRARDVLAALPPTWRWLERAGDLAADAGAFPAALENYTAALDHLAQKMDTQSDPFAVNLKAGLLAKRAACALAAGHLDTAAADYTQLEMLLPRDPTFAFYRGLALFLQGDLAQARTLCRAAWERANATLREEMARALTAPEYTMLRDFFL